MTQRGSRPFVRYWLPVLAYVALIFIVSAQPRLRPPMQWPNSDKLAHVLEYMVLGILLGRALRTVPRLAGPLLGGLAAVAIGAGVGCADEILQSFVPGRESSLRDLMADGVGLSLSQIAYLVLKRE